MATTTMYSLAEGLPASKRLKTHYTPNYKEFQPGSIIRCKLSNFMSYSLTEFHFGPKMNLIIGPNGSGKSTFVCAVCIGLNGKLSNLGKETMSTDNFIKDNTNEAFIELEMKSFDENDESVIIKTKLIKNQKTEWEINNKQANENDIKKLLKKFNIQLDNLCQFLPQDRVSKFADLKSEDLLKEIERSYGNGELLEDHYSIIKLQTTINQEQKSLDEFNDLLVDLKEKNESLKETVEKHRHYLKLQKDLEKTKMIRPYVKLQDKKNEMINYKESFGVQKESFQKFLDKILPIEESLKNFDKSLVKTDEIIKDIESSNFKINKEMKLIEEKINKFDNKIENYVSQMKDYDLKLSQSKNDYFKLKDDYNKIEDELNNLDLPNEEDVKQWKEKRLQLKNEFLEFDDIITELRSKIRSNEVNIEKIKNKIITEQKRLNSKDRLNTLDPRKFRLSIESVQLLRQLKNNSFNNQLNFNYFEPAIITLNVKDKSIAPIIETLIPFTHLNAIVVPNKNDFNEISKFLYDEKKCMVSIRTLGYKDFDISRDQISRDKILNLGFDGFITDFLTGPNEVIQMLCENIYLNRIPVSIRGLTNEQKDTINKEIERGLELVKYVSYDEIYTMNRSNFGKRQVTTNIKSFRLKSNIFENGLSEEQKNLINNNINRLNNEFKNIENDINKFKEEVSINNRNYNEKKEEFNKYEEYVKRAGFVIREENKFKQKLQMINERLTIKKKEIKLLKQNNNDENKGKIFEKIEIILNEKMKIQREDKRLNLIKKINNDNELIKLKIKKTEESNKIESIKLLNQSISKEKQEKESILENLKNLYKKSKKIYQETLSSYKIKVSEYSIEDKDDMKNIIEEMAESNILNEEGLNLRIAKIESEMKLNNRTGGESSIQQLEDNKVKIIQLEGDIPKLNKSLKLNKEEIITKINNWEKELNKIVEIISKDFGKNMSEIASAGNIKLDKNFEDYGKWKLIIQVSFRDNEPLSNFNGAQHSGGEKSTTTAVFLNSLQGLTNTPFRVVDEINQGMDAKNERKAHELIVKRATESVKASQYFLITPKLLTDLYYANNMTVHCIFAGKWCPGYSSELPYLEMGITEKYTG